MNEKFHWHRPEPPAGHVFVQAPVCGLMPDDLDQSRHEGTVRSGFVPIPGDPNRSRPRRREGGFQLQGCSRFPRDDRSQPPFHRERGYADLEQSRPEPAAKSGFVPDLDEPSRGRPLYREGRSQPQEYCAEVQRSRAPGQQLCQDDDPRKPEPRRRDFTDHENRRSRGDSCPKKPRQRQLPKIGESYPRRAQSPGGSVKRDFLDTKGEIRPRRERSISGQCNSTDSGQTRPRLARSPSRIGQLGDDREKELDEFDCLPRDSREREFNKVSHPAGKAQGPTTFEFDDRFQGHQRCAVGGSSASSNHSKKQITEQRGPKLQAKLVWHPRTASLMRKQERQRVRIMRTLRAILT